MAGTEVLTRSFIGAINSRDWDAVSGMLADGALHHHSGGQAKGPEEIVSLYKMLCEQLGWQIAIYSVAATDTWAAVLHRNELSVGSFDVCTSARVDDGRVAELWTAGMPPLPAS